MPKMHGLSGHFHVLHQMVNPPATAKPHIESEDDQMHNQFVNVMLILLQTINDIIEATPNDIGSQNDVDEQI